MEETHTTDKVAIEIRLITKSYAQPGGLFSALDHLSLTVASGEIHGVIGPSGAGKTTLLRVIMHSEPVDSGEIILAGHNWTALSDDEVRPLRATMGVVFQHLHLLTSRTVLDNVLLPLELLGTPREASVARATELLDWFGLADKAREYPSRLSGGQRQRVALARALSTKPSILLADEPTSALDAETKESVLKLLARIRAELGVTIVLITHDLHAAALLCDTLSVLDRGRIVESGPAQSLLRNPQSDAARRLLEATAGFSANHSTPQSSILQQRIVELG